MAPGGRGCSAAARHHNSSQLADILNPVQGIRDQQRRFAADGPHSEEFEQDLHPCRCICRYSMCWPLTIPLSKHNRAGLVPVDHAKANREAIKQQSRANRERKVLASQQSQGTVPTAMSLCGRGHRSGKQHGVTMRPVTICFMRRLRMKRKVLGEPATPDTLRRAAPGSSGGPGRRGPSFGPPSGPPADGKYRCWLVSRWTAMEPNSSRWIAPPRKNPDIGLQVLPPAGWSRSATGIT